MARAFVVSEPTVRHYLDILVATCMVWVLPPWFENVSKRQVRAPKVYLADSGLLHTLLDVPARAEALPSPSCTTVCSLKPGRCKACSRSPKSAACCRLPPSFRTARDWALPKRTAASR